MYRSRAPNVWLALIFAVVGGVLLAKSEWIGGAILVVLALLSIAGAYFDKGDSSGLYPW